MVDDLASSFAKSAAISGKKQVPVVSSFDLQGIAEYIRDGKAKNIITMCGAGISTSAGIPDFRSPNSGLYAKLASFNLPYPEAVFSIDYFRKKPEPFFKLTKELWPKSVKPTITHYFIKMLHDKGLLLRHYTQNIDGLEFVAALPPEKIVEAHGSFRTGTCLKCNQQYGINWLYERVERDELPKCSKASCNGVVKPDVVFFGEKLPDRFFDNVPQDFAKCDLLIVMGTSLTVQPFSLLVQRVSQKCPRLVINRDKVGSRDRSDSGSDSDTDADLEQMFGSCDLSFNSDDNYRDVFHACNCDDGCKQLADLLGWRDDLEQHVQQQHELLEKHPAKPYTAPKPVKSD